MVEILESPFKSNTSGSYLSKRYLFIRSNHSHSVAPPQDIELLHLYPPVPESPVLPEPFSPVFPLLVFPLSPEPPVFPVLLLPPPVFPVLLSPPVPVLPVSLPALLSLFVSVLPTSSLLLSGLGLLTSALEPSKLILDLPLYNSSKKSLFLSYFRLNDVAPPLTKPFIANSAPFDMDLFFIFPVPFSIASSAFLSLLQYLESIYQTFLPPFSKLKISSLFCSLV